MATLALALPSTAAADTVRAGVGRADITPPTGYFFFGWVRSDSRAEGQHTRLFARSIVLDRGGQKVALVSVDLGAIPNGLVVDAARHLQDLGIRQQDLIISASHTHGGPSGYFNYSAFNTIAPSQGNPAGGKVGAPADKQLYTFLVRQVAASIRRAAADLAPAKIGWGQSQLLGVTDNRSIEAFLANFGLYVEPGQGSPEMAPGGYPQTIDPDMNVLRVDKVVGDRRIPVGIFPIFANHGTVNRPSYQVYNGDHHSSAERVTEAAIRQLGHVSRKQDVVVAFGNSNEGDQTAGLHRAGPANAEWVGRAESRAMLEAWRRAGENMDTPPYVQVRWTRFCYCGQWARGGLVDRRGVAGLPFTTGSEENRGPLYDTDKQSFEGREAPTDLPPQGRKIPAYVDMARAMPNAVPISVARIADRVLVTVPGEMTVEMGRRVRAAAAKEAGVDPSQVVLSGLANDFVQYFTTPEEYERQHYEGGSTLFGEFSSNLLMEQLAMLAKVLAVGDDAPPPYEFDTQNGTTDNAQPFPTGADKASVMAEPKTTPRLGHAEFRWQGGQRGYDRPVERAFVIVQRRVRGRWRRVADDLGLEIQWKVDKDGAYTARWEPSRRAPLGLHRFVITANRYRVQSQPFKLTYSRALKLRRVGTAGLVLSYPDAAYETDFTYRPPVAEGARLTAKAGSRRVAVKSSHKGFLVRARKGQHVTVAAGGARDRWGNRNAAKYAYTAR